MSSGLGAPASGSPVGSRMVDVPTPSRPKGALAGHKRPKALLMDMPSGLLTPVKPAVVDIGLWILLRNRGLCALYICTKPPSAEAWFPAAAKAGGITRTSVPLGSMERNDPGSWWAFAGGAPKFEVL